MEVAPIIRLRLDGELSIRDASALAAQLLEAIAGEGEVVVDTTGLIVVDTAILQLLVSAHRSARELGKSLAVQAPSGGVLEEMLRRSGAAAPAGAVLVWDGDLWTGVEAKEAA